ncbi:hypothetical protein BVRB_7g166590 [Beta vulgaris subsp. vulgaris]|nr:hypothetical protein BVRB_7g166590 [Beta vulgaris subsp. vulgaris]
MVRFLSSLHGEYIPYWNKGGFEGVLALVCLMVLSISVISMLLFVCADHFGNPRRRRRWGHGGGDGGGDGGGGCGGGGGGGGD